MSLQLIMGGSGSGKTAYIYDYMIQQSMKNPNRTYILVVPEQFTLQAQQRLIQRHPRHGIMNIEVLSFNRLCFRIIEDLELTDKTMLKDSGKSMVIRKLIQDSMDQYQIIGNHIHRKGYIKELLDMITEFYQYDIHDDQLNEIVNQVKNPLLHDKIKDLQLLFQSYKGYLENHFITSESTLDLLVNSISSSDLLNHAEIWMDGFYGFTPIQYKVIKQFMLKVHTIGVSITIDSGEDFSDLKEESELFFESKKVIQQLRKMARDHKVLVEDPIMISNKNPRRFIQNDTLQHLSKNLFHYPYEIYQAITKGLYLCEAASMREEVSYVTDSIMKLVMQEGYRFKDIAILTGDINGYEGIIKKTLKQYGIPHFMDKKKSIMTHPLVDLLSSALEVIEKNFNFHSIFRYLKSGLLDISQEEIDLIENYALSYGIRGEKAWLKKWEKPYPLIFKEDNEDYQEEVLDRINQLKDQWIQPLIEMKSSVGKENSTVESITRAVIRFFESLEILSKIQEMEEKFKEENKLSYQKEYEQIYGMVVEVLDQIVHILKDKKIVVSEYRKLITSGLEQCEMGLVPPAMDQVVVGDLERTRIQEVKALFVLGFNEGKIPRTSEQTNLLTDLERTQIKEFGYILAPDDKENLYKEQFNIYMSLLRGREKLFISFSKMNADGKSIRPSILFSQIKKMFPKCTVYSIKDLYDKRIIVNRPNPTYANLIQKMTEVQNLSDLEALKEVYLWFHQNKNWKDKLRQSREAIDHKNQEVSLNQEIIHGLYGEDFVSSVSRLEEFSKCPFAHFITYGLQLKERPEYVVKVPDIGILFHKAIDRFSKKISLRGISWEKLEKDTLEAIVQEAIVEVVEEEQRGVFFSTSRNQYLVNRLTRIVKRAVWAIHYQITKGNFKPIHYEYSFDGTDAKESLVVRLDDAHIMKLRGQIDRLDTYEDEDAVYLTIVDYKSGNKSIDMVALYYGLQLQLFVYLKAATEIQQKNVHKKVVPAGVFYFHIDDPVIKEIRDRNDETIEKELKKQLKLKGLVLDQKEVIYNLDSSFQKQSDVIPISLTASGELSKNSSVATCEQFETIEQFVAKKTKEIGKDIFEGNVDITPYKRKTNTSCDYCSYASICQFENGICGNEFKQLKELSKDEIWEYLKTE